MLLAILKGVTFGYPNGLKDKATRARAGGFSFLFALTNAF
jgi:hypothetical protein